MSVFIPKIIVRHFLKQKYSSFTIKLYIIMLQLQEYGYPEIKFSARDMAYELGLYDGENYNERANCDVAQSALNLLKRDGLIDFTIQNDGKYFLTRVAKTKEEFTYYQTKKIQK